jgi:hypothetical protein
MKVASSGRKFTPSLPFGPRPGSRTHGTRRAYQCELRVHRSDGTTQMAGRRRRSPVDAGWTIFDGGPGLG